MLSDSGKVCLVDWFKIWPAHYLVVINRITDGDLRAAFSLLLWHCLNENGLPDNNDDIAFLTGLRVERITELRPYLARLATAKDGRLMLTPADETIRERQEFAAKKAQAGKAGGKQKQANKDNVKQMLAEVSTASAKLASAGNSKTPLAIPSQTDKQSCSNSITVKTEREEQEENSLSVADAEEEIFRAKLDAIEALVFKASRCTYRDDLIQKQLSKTVAALISLGATVDEVREFVDTREKSTPINYFRERFEGWRADRTGNGRHDSRTHYADGREKPIEKVGFVS